VSNIIFALSKNYYAHLKQTAFTVHFKPFAYSTDKMCFIFRSKI